MDDERIYEALVKLGGMDATMLSLFLDIPKKNVSSLLKIFEDEKWERGADGKWFALAAPKVKEKKKRKASLIAIDANSWFPIPYKFFVDDKGFELDTPLAKCVNFWNLMIREHIIPSYLVGAGNLYLIKHVRKNQDVKEFEKFLLSLATWDIQRRKVENQMVLESLETEYSY